MAGINKVILVGRLGKDPEGKNTRDGKSFCSFSLATSKRFKDQEKTTWHNVTVWNEHSAKYIVDYAVRGSLVYVEGEIEVRSYEKNGVTMYATDIVVGQWSGAVQILNDGKGRQEARTDKKESYAEASGAGKPDYASELDDEIPF